MGRSSEDLIETERLLLVPLESKHADGIYEATIASRTELLPWMPWARDPTLDWVRGRAAVTEHGRTEAKEFSFVMIERATDMVLGVIGLDSNGDATFSLRYWIRTDRAGRGLTTEAGLALLDWARSTLGVTRFTLWAGRENLASRRVAEKLGFVHVGPLGWRPDGGTGQFDAESYELNLG